MPLLRLDKLLTESGYGSRSQVKQMIAKGRVHVDGAAATRPELKVDPEHSAVEVDGIPVAYAAYEYYMLHKPAGYVSATKDSRYPTVLELITGAVRADLFPVGRLDLDTEGLLLITNDGALAHRLLSPKKHVPKTYEARVSGLVTREDAEAFREGIDIGEPMRTLPAKLRVISGNREESCVEIVITEGRYHQIKRMFAARGREVLYLKRISMGGLTLDDTLKKGEYRPLSGQEVTELRQS